MRQPDMTWRADTEGRCTWVSAGYAAFVGRDAQEARGDGWVMAIHPDDRQAVIANVRECTRRQLGFLAIYRLKAADGKYYWVRDIGGPRFCAGVCVGYLGSVSKRGASTTASVRDVVPFRVPCPAARQPMVCDPAITQSASEPLAESR